MINDHNYNRQYVISGIAIIVVLTYIIRLFILQVVDQSTQRKAENNAQLRQTIYPARGLIYDRNDQLLVANQPVYEVTIVVREIENNPFDTIGFCENLHITLAEFHERMQDLTNTKKNRGYSRYTPQVFMEQLSQEDVASLQQELYKYSGVDIRCRTIRDYMYPVGAHLLGSVGEINQEDLKNDSYYSRGDYSGREGIERTYEKQLRGTKGVKILMRDSRGRIQGSYQNGKEDSEAVAGEDLHLGLEIQTQILAEKLLQGKIGSVVAIEPKTGEILTLVSAPNWDPKALVGKERSKNYSRLLKSTQKPLLNRATQAQYSPGSTIKVLQALIGLQEGIVTPHTEYPCDGPTSRPIRCTHRHDNIVDLEEAIEQSCNPYFWELYRDLLQQDGYSGNNTAFKSHYEDWRKHIMSFGLGSKFEESDLHDQSNGAIPSVELYDKLYGKRGWKAITIRSLAIGQGELLATPLQLANQAAAIANKGYYITPHLNRADSITYTTYRTTISEKYFSTIHRGMMRVMTEGTGKYYNVPALKMCGKTGTVQNAHGKDHSLYIGFAPQDNPQIAIAVVIENAGFGSTWACPIATLLMEQYLTGKTTREWLVNNIINNDIYGIINEH